MRGPDTAAGSSAEVQILAPNDRTIKGCSLYTGQVDTIAEVEARLNVGQDRNHTADEPIDVGAFFSVQAHLVVNETAGMVSDGKIYMFPEPWFSWPEDSPLILAFENSGGSTTNVRVECDVWYTEP